MGWLQITSVTWSLFPLLLLIVSPCIKLKTMGGRAFSYNGPKLWNALPAFIRNAASLDCFKKLLKTHLFSKSFLFMIIYCDSVVLVDLFLVDLLFCLYMLKRFEFKKAHYK